MTFTRAIGVASQYVLDRIVRSLALAKIHPNVLTALGLVINIVAAVLFGRGKFFQAGLVVLGAGVFDMVDGRVARLTNWVQLFGGILNRFPPPAAVAQQIKALTGISLDSARSRACDTA